MSEPTPLILNPGTNEFVTPNNHADVVVKEGECVDLWCSDRFTDFNEQLLKATCVGGVNFEVYGKLISFKNFRCKTWPDFTARYTDASCADNGRIISVGFEITRSRFVEQYQICYNSDEESTYYSKYMLGPYSKYYQSKVDRVDFRQGNFFGKKSVNSLYTQRRQIDTISSELQMNANIYFNTKKYVFLSRGHLVAKADFVFGAQQRATFFFCNVAPQWQIINAGNWGQIEILVRDLANSRRSTFIAYSGTYGVSTLPNKYGEETPLYLSGHGKYQIPVPKLYYRLLIEEPTKYGAVLITVNDPHKSYEQLQQQGYILCEDVSSQLSYFRDFSTRTDLDAGYTYACTVPDFLKRVKSLPDLYITGLLY